MTDPEATGQHEHQAARGRHDPLRGRRVRHGQRRLLPDKGLAKGSVVAVDRVGILCLALLAGPSRAGMWCGVAGLPDLGIVAAAEAGAEPGRMMLVPEPGPRWAEVAATMLDACEVVLLRPPGHAPAQARRRLETAACRSGAALIVAGTWDGAPVRLHVTRQQ